MGDEGISEYEKQRLARISENKARLEALGLPHLASVVLGSFQPADRNLKKCKGKRSVQAAGNDEDEEYLPSESDDERMAEDGKEGSSSASGEDEEHAIVSSGSRRKGKNRSSSFTAKVKKKIAYEGLNDTDILDDEAALRQALALSLVASKCYSTGTSSALSQTSTSNVGKDAQKRRFKGKAQKNVTGKQKTLKQNKARAQLTEDEVVAYFFSFDEYGKGYITQRDVKKMVSSHDFSWTDIEIAKMIHCFDNDGDGKLSLEDFKTIVSRCRMLQGTEGT